MSEFRAADDDREQQQWLRVTLSSIGDGVIATDAQGRVKFLNPIAETLTGWTEHEAKGEPLDVVFHIINEQTREVVENPVAKVLATGRIVGLANHTILVAKDGMERAIDDSAAPIRNEQGQTVGVVLVFRDVSDQRRAERRRNARLAITQILAQETDSETAAAEIISAVCIALQWDAGSVWRADADEKVLRCREFRQVSARNLEAFRQATLGQSFAPGNSLPGRVWQSRQPLWVPDITKDPHFVRAPQAEEVDLHGAFACPFTAGEKFLGAIEFFSQQIQPPDDDLLEMVTTIGRQFGQFIERRRAEQKLRRSEKELADFFENANVGLHWVGPDGIIQRVNRAELDLLGYSRDEYVGRHIAEFHVDPPVIEDILARLSRGEVLHDRPARMRAKDGSIRDVLINSSVLFEDDRFIHTRCFTLDVTEAKRAQQGLARLAAIVASSDDAIISKDINGIVTSWNQAAEQIFGYSADEIIGQPIALLAPPDRVDEMPAILERIRRGERVDHFETMRRAKDGRLVPISLTVSPIRDESGNIVGASKIARDVSERIRAEDALRAERARLQATLVSIGDAVIVTDAQGNVTLTNPIAQDLTGWSGEELLGRPLEEVFRIVNEETRVTVENPATRALREGVIVGLANHTVLIRKDGTEIPIDDSAAPIKDAQGQILGCVLIFRDITERRMAERALRESQERYSLVVAGAEAAIWDWDVLAKRVAFSPRWKELRGLADDEVGNDEKEWSSRIHPDDTERVMQAVQAHFEGRTPSFSEEYRVRHKDGRWIWILDRGIAMRDRAGRVVRMAGSETEITERKQAEEELRRAEQFTRSVVNNVIDAIITIDESGTIESINPATERIFGYTGSEIIGQNVKTLMPEPYHQEHDGYIANYQRTGDAKIIGIGREVVGRRKDGSLFPMELAVSAFWLGDRRHFTGIVRDITERKRDEEALKEADRRKNEFLATLAHELRNPLAPIRTGLELMRMVQDDPAMIAKAQATMERQVKHMVRLVDDLLDVSRIARGKVVLQTEVVELADLIRDAIDVTRPLIDEQRQELTVSLPEKPIYLNVDAIRVAQAVSNLLNNASKYSDRAGHIWLTAEQRDGEVFVTVRDSGMGIEAGQLPGIFEMFSQAAPALDRSRGGLGVGLSLVKGIVELHGGSIEASSGGTGMGSEFRIRLPANTTTSPQSQQTNDEQQSSESSGQRILVVDDSHDVANLMASALRLMGHEAHVAYDGLEGVQAAGALRPDVVLLDIGLPKMNGYEAARAIREQQWGKQMRLIALSGWGQDEDKRRAQEAGFDHHLTKPVSTSVLQTVIDSTAP